MGGLRMRVLSPALATLLCSGMIGACTDRAHSEQEEWPSPDEIAGSRFSGSCIVVDGDIKCWIPRAAPMTDEAEVLLARSEAWPSSPLPRIELGSDFVAAGVEGVGDLRCAVSDSGHAKCWGFNASHGLGLPDPMLAVGDDPSEMGDALPNVDLGAEARGIAIVGGQGGGGACAWLADGGVKCWGRSVDGSLGVQHGEILGDELGEMGANLPYVALGDVDVVALDGAVGGGPFVCALTSIGDAKCWGDNSRGQLGSGDQEDRGGDPSAMGDNLRPIDLGTEQPIEQIAVGREHACALVGGRVKCWGANSDRSNVDGTWEYEAAGRLGTGDTDDRGRRADDMGEALPYVALGDVNRAVAVSAGSDHSCAVLDDGRLKCWGANASGQLGLGDDEDRGDEPDEMGDALPYVDLGTDRTVRALRCLHRETCVLLDDGAVKCWGQGVGDDPGEMGDALEPVLLSSDLVEAAG